ncbi:MAG: tetratricopeptide repeat protein [Candidatus Methanoperedens sp.]|nr:tetratricopeptide repeat protein [Candidatus Methanoperedens sp.]MCZ7371238.1 tetratricopeptide repeat protein [Candidatus Methanoperedens sp.]
MKDTEPFPDVRDLLRHLGYNETSIQEIIFELDILFKEINFDILKQAAISAVKEKDTPGLINSLKDLMLHLENKGYYRPDFPAKLIMLLVNGLDLANQDIFALLDKSSIPEKEKLKEQEFLASCAAITQLGYILSSSIVPEIKAASSGPHVFLVIDIPPDRMIFVDYSIGSIKDIDIVYYERKENYYSLKNTDGMDVETSKLLTDYYSSFHVTSSIGLSHNIHNNLGIAYDMIGRYEDAINELKAALRLNPDYIEVHNNLAVTYDKMGKADDAIRELLEALGLNPGYTEAHSNLGNIYARSGRYDEALVEIREALRIDPGYAPAHNNLGNIYAAQKRNNEAITEFNEALKINPEYVLARNNLGNIYSESGMYEEAIKEFQEALRIDPGIPEAHHGMASAYYNLGSYDRASRAWINAVYLDPELLECVPDKLSLKVRQGISRLRR